MSRVRCGNVLALVCLLVLCGSVCPCAGLSFALNSDGIDSLSKLWQLTDRHWFCSLSFMRIQTT